MSILAPVAAAFLLQGCIQETFPEGGALTAGQVDGAENSLVGKVNALTSALMSSGTAGYSSLYGTQVDFGMPAIHIMTEAMLEDLAIAGNVQAFQFYMFSYNLGQNDTEWPIAYFWDCYYAWIKLANDIIAEIDPQTDDEEEQGYLGIAYAYRAMFYLDLARMYEFKPNGYTSVPDDVLGLTVPIVTEKTTEEESTFNPRVPREDMYTFIMSDLDKAAGFLKDRTYSYSRPTLGAVYGLYARAWLEKGYWTEGGDESAFREAARYARLSIDTSHKTPLTQDEWEDPQTGFNSGASNNSWIWGLTVSSEMLANLLAFNAHLCSEALWGYCYHSNPSASVSFYNNIDDKDFRKHSWLDPKRFDYYDYKLAGTETEQDYFLNGNEEMQISPARNYQTIKFRPVGGEMMDYVSGNPADHPLMRVEEMYFIEMEATAHYDLGQARTLLNSFMRYRVTDGSYNCDPRTADLDSFINEMFFQKRVEFWGEGVLFFDYKRLDKGITRHYTGTNHPSIWQFNTDGRSPQWNIVIGRGEFQSNTAINDSNNNPSPAGALTVPQS